MKLLNGFRKKYFSLASIQAHSTALKIHTTNTIYKYHLNIKNFQNTKIDENEEESSIQINELTLITTKNTKPDFLKYIAINKINKYPNSS